MNAEREWQIDLNHAFQTSGKKKVATRSFVKEIGFTCREAKKGPVRLRKKN